MSDDLIGTIEAVELIGEVLTVTVELSGTIETPLVELVGVTEGVPELSGTIQPTIILNGHIYYHAVVNGVSLFVDLGDVNVENLQDNDIIVYDADTQKFINLPASSIGATGDLTYVHNQVVPAATWTISHPLNKFPSIVVVDSGGTIVHGEIIYDSLSQIRVLFSAAFAGKAYLN
jgi:hypothetical protein